MMWSIGDRDAPEVAQNVYEQLFRLGRREGDGEGEKMPDARGAAQALHVAVARLRARNVPSTSWVPFIHVGLRIRVVGFCDVSDVLRLVVRRTLCSAGPGMVHAVGYHHVFIIISWRTSHIVDRISGYCTPNSSIEG